MQRDSISAVCGYSSLSIMFLSAVAAIRRRAWLGIEVVTNVARFSRALPSSASSLVIASQEAAPPSPCSPAGGAGGPQGWRARQRRGCYAAGARGL